MVHAGQRVIFLLVEIIQYMMYVYNVCMLNCSCFCLTLTGVICNKVLFNIDTQYSACSFKTDISRLCFPSSPQLHRKVYKVWILNTAFLHFNTDISQFRFPSSLHLHRKVYKTWIIQQKYRRFTVLLPLYISTQIFYSSVTLVNFNTYMFTVLFI